MTELEAQKEAARLRWHEAKIQKRDDEPELWDAYYALLVQWSDEKTEARKQTA